jgi:small basic protein (TIGR04137 family)
MARHSSLKNTSTIKAMRNVLKRFERIDILSKTGRWKQGDKVLGLPKTKNVE